MAIRNSDGSTFQLKRPNPLMKFQDFEEKFVLHNFDDWQETNILPPPPAKKVETTVPATSCYCLPAIIRTTFDALYNEERRTVTYGEKFALVVDDMEASDLSYRFTTGHEIAVGSIIFVKQRRRWWKVVQCDPLKEQWLISCVPSTENPVFSD